VAFMALEELFEPTVMLFRLTNQTMMNKIPQDLISTAELVSFIDNVIVGIEEEEDII